MHEPECPSRPDDYYDIEECTCPPLPPAPRKPPLSFREQWSNALTEVMDWEITRWALVILVIWGMSSAYGWITAPETCPPDVTCVYADRSDRYDPFARDWR